MYRIHSGHLRTQLCNLHKTKLGAVLGIMGAYHLVETVYSRTSIRSIICVLVGSNDTHSQHLRSLVAYN